MKTSPLCHQITYLQVARCIEHFYTAVQRDELLSGYFSSIGDWPTHRRHICNFWWGLMGGKVANPRPHAMDRGHRALTFGNRELTRWLELFQQTLDGTLEPEPAQRWMALARQLGDKMLGRGMLKQK